MKVVLCSFADSSFCNVIKRFQYEAMESGFFDDVVVYTEKDFDDDFWSRHHEFIEKNPRGYGYWMWKPYVVNRTLKSIDEGDILVYLDTGCGINKTGVKKFNHYLRLVKESNLGCVCFYNGYIEKDWCKGDVLDYFKVRDNKEITDSQQIMGGIFFVRKNRNICQLIDRWEHTTSNYYHLLDDSESESPNLPGFRENRHDQTIFSLLLKTTGGMVCLPDTEVEVDMPYRTLAQRTYRRFKHNPILAIRDREGVVYEKKNIIYYWIDCIRWDIENYIADKFPNSEACTVGKEGFKLKLCKIIVGRLKKYTNEKVPH